MTADVASHKNWVDEGLKLLILWGGFLAILGLGILTVGGDNYMIAGLLLALLLALICVLTSVRMLAFIWVFGVPTFFVFANNIMVSIPFATAGRIVFFAMLLGVVGAMLMRRGSKAPFSPVEGWALVFLGLGAASITLNSGSRPADKIGPDTALLIQGYLIPFLGFYVMRRFSWTSGLAKGLCITLMAAGAVLGIVGGVQVFAGVNILEASWGEVLSAHEGRAYGPFSNATELGAVCLFSMLVGLLMLRRVSGGLSRVALFGLIGLSFVGVVTCQTRAVWLAGIVALGFLFLGDPKSRRTLISLGALGAAAIALYLPVLLSSDVFRERIMEVSPILNRLASTATAMSVIGDNPLFGVGWGRDTFQEAKQGHYADWGDISGAWAVDVGPPHNEWLHVAAMLGIPGLIVLLVVWALLWRRLARVTRDKTQPVFNREFATYAQALIVATLAMSLFVDLGFFLYFVAAAWMFAGLAVALSEQTSAVGREGHAA
ncbi:MAG: O-antigen ligase family protein [Pseudomonadota bacterium]